MRLSAEINKNTLVGDGENWAVLRSDCAMKTKSEFETAICMTPREGQGERVLYDANYKSILELAELLPRMLIYGYLMLCGQNIYVLRLISSVLNSWLEGIDLF